MIDMNSGLTYFSGLQIREIRIIILVLNLIEIVKSVQQDEILYFKFLLRKVMVGQIFQFYDVGEILDFGSFHFKLSFVL